MWRWSSTGVLVTRPPRATVQLQEDSDTITGVDTEIIAISADRLTRAEYAVEALGFVVDRQGNIRWEYIGYDSYYDRPDNEGIIAQLQRLS